MQRLFAEPTAWQAPWLPAILPRIQEITARHAERTVFTRFITARAPGLGHGAWKRYYERWADVTIANLGIEMLDLVPELRLFAPPAAIFDKHVYSPWMKTKLHGWLRERRINTLVITDGETDVCVLAAVRGAIDLGYRVVVVKDEIWSSADETHDKMVDVYCERFQSAGLAAAMSLRRNHAGPENSSLPDFPLDSSLTSMCRGPARQRSAPVYNFIFEQRKLQPPKMASPAKTLFGLAPSPS